jgi:hypothetical protein
LAEISWSANYFRYFDQVLTTVIGSRKIPGRKIRPVNWYSIFLPHIFLLLAVGFELPNQYQLIFADELKLVGFQLNGVKQFDDPAELGEVIEWLAQQNKQINVTGRTGLIARYGAVQNQPLEL